MKSKLAIRIALAKCELVDKIAPRRAALRRETAAALHRPGVNHLHGDGINVLHRGGKPDSADFIRLLAEERGLKDLCYELRISPSLAYQWLSGEKNDPLDRTRKILEIAVNQKRRDIAIAVLKWLAAEIDCGLMTGDHARQLDEIAKAVNE